jgi:hypothetical protein
MRKLFIVVFLGFWLLLLCSCSSTPSGTISIEEIQKTAASKLGQSVVVVGKVETRTSLSSMGQRMFKLYKGDQSVWVQAPENEELPPQGYAERVTGTIQEKEFSAAVGKIYYIQATSIKIE